MAVIGVGCRMRGSMIGQPLMEVSRTIRRTDEETPW
jgi:hypothetical protein